MSSLIGRASKSARRSRSGISFKTSISFVVKVTFDVEGHQNTYGDPNFAHGSLVSARFTSLSSPKLRLRASPFAQDDTFNEVRTPPKKTQTREIQYSHNLVGALHEAPAGDSTSPLRYMINTTARFYTFPHFLKLLTKLQILVIIYLLHLYL